MLALGCRVNDWIRNKGVLFRKPRQLKNERSDYHFTVSARRNKIDARAVASEKNVQHLKEKIPSFLTVVIF